MHSAASSDSAYSSFSRRNFFRFAAMASTFAAIPIASEFQLAYAQRRLIMNDSPSEVVLIDANENPLGPCEAACQAMTNILPHGGRYDYNNSNEELVRIFTEQEGLSDDHVLVYAGSSEPLHYSVLAFTSPERGYVTADPGYEAGMRAASLSGARISKVALTPTYAHDVKAMVVADPNAGLLYICNPNNPTGTITSRTYIQYALAHKPKNSILLVDEAYIHLSDAQSCMDLVKAGKDIILLRTFSKIYGMAGIRCGFAIARPDLLDKLLVYGRNPMPITAVVGARTSLLDKDLIPKRKKINSDIRADIFEWLTANHYSFTPSQSNCFMLDTKRPGEEVIAAMAQRKVIIGRLWPVWPTHVRVTVGTEQDMTAFKKAFKEVMNSNTTGLKLGPLRFEEILFTHIS
jgi:histidinol-phosphate aminotransferase